VRFRSRRRKKHDGLARRELWSLTRLLSNTIDNDRFPLLPRILILKTILGKIRPEPTPEPLPPPKVYAPPRATTARRRRRG
jgi:hypothetical protein